MVASDKPCTRGCRPAGRAGLGGALALILALGASPAARAAPSLTRVSTGRPGWSLGLGFLSYGWPYPDVTRWSRFVPLVNAQGDGFYVHGLEAGWWFYRRRGLRASLVLAPELWHLSPRFGPFARGLGDRLATLLGGVRGGVVHRFYAVRLTALRDLLARSDGEVVRISAGPRWRGQGWALSSRVGLDWESPNQVDYYFGVPPSAALPGRPAYEPGGTVDVDGTVVVGRRLGSHFEAVASFEETWYGAAIRESPLAVRATSWSALVGLMFRFR